MQNRLRHWRKRRGLTLQQVAERSGTTAQTVSRVETGAMRLSADWIAAFARALDVQPSDLIDTAGKPGLRFLGQAGADGRVQAGGDAVFAIDVPAARPVAVRVTTAAGPFAAGEILIGDLLDGAAIAHAAGQDAIVETGDGTVHIGRLLPGARGRWTVAPPGPGHAALSDVRLRWAARIVMRVRYT